MKHKILLSLVAVLLTALSAQAYDFKSGDLYYKITSDTTVEVTYQFSSSYNNYQGLTTAIIPETVTYNGTTYSVISIGNYAFDDCSSLTSVTIPNSVTSIGDYAFSGCSSLTSLTIPNSVTSIRDNAFEYCSSITSITIPNSVTSIGEKAFRDCSGLTSINLVTPSSITKIENKAFHGTPWFTSQPNGVVYLGDVLYSYKGSMPQNTSIIVNSGTKAITNFAFYNCSGLTSITIPNSVTSIGEKAFRACSGLTSITIPNSVTSIGSYAFDGCSGLTSITIPNSVTSIGSYVFYGCSGLTSITIPNSVTSIGESAFSGCSGLTSINLVTPSSITEIGSSAFQGTHWLTNQPDGVVYLGDVLYSYKGSMPQNTSVIVNSGTKAINSYAFSSCSGLTSITIPSSVTSIGSYAFRFCSGLTSITIPNSVTSIGSYAFYGCSGLTSVTIGNSVTSIGESAFSGCSGLTSVTIGNSVTSIGEWAFSDCSGLTSVTIPNSVTSIGRSAFHSCSGMTSVTIGNSVTSIGESAFYECSGLTSVIIGNSVTSIGWNAFSNCVRLTSLTCEAKTPPSCNINNSFYNIPAKCTIKVPCGCLEAYNTVPWFNYQLTIIPPPSLQVQPSSESLGSTTIDQEVDCDSTAIVSATANYGYHFLQWSDSATSNPRTIKLTKDTLLTAEFARNSYRILTSYEGAGKVEGDSTALYKDLVILTAVPDYGWEFRYWNENNVVRLDNPCKVEVTADCSFKAIFVKRNFNLSASCEHGTIAGGGTYTYETNCSLTATPAVGYHFVQWSDGITENPRSIVLTKDTNLTAEFAKNSYRIYLTHEGEGSIEGDTTALYQDSVTLTAVADYGWQFSCWNDNNVGRMDNPRKVEVTGDCAYRAIFVKRMFTITLTGENGTIAGGGTYAYETNCSLTATPAVGYHFVQWSDGITENPRSIVLTKDTNLTAEFAKNSYQITISHTGNGMTMGDTTALYQDTITLSALADYGWDFSGWEDGNTENPRVVVATEDKDYKAIFVKRMFTITLTGENGTIAGGGTYAYETNCSITATPAVGYHFVQWSDSITDNPRSIVLTKDTNLTAEFAKNSYQITTSHTGNGMTMGDTTALYQDTITLSALADYGWEFSGWEDGNTENPRVVVATEDKDYKAIFVKRMFTITLTGENGSFEGAGSFAYGDTCQLTAIANVGYHFVQWSDSITDNPRSIVLTQDTTFTALFAQSFAGQCGDSLYWNFGDNELNITGTGAMYDYTKTTMPWMLFRDSIYLIRIGDSATYVGEYAFAGCPNLGTLFVGESVETIAENTLANCRNLHVVYSYPTIPPYAENNSFTNYNGYLYVPCDSKRDYTLDAVWGQFKYIECIEEETDIESVESESSEQSVRKIYRDGHIYILRDGEEYSILGQKL